MESGAADERDVIFARAQRHSRRVTVLKRAVPAIAVVLGLGFLGFTYVVSPAAVLIDVAESAISNGRLVMASPKLEGFTPDNKPYSMTALRAFQDLKDVNQIELEEISATLPYENDIATLTAPRGFYDRTANTFEIKGEMQIKTEAGLSAQLNSAFVDITKASVKSEMPVEVKLDGGTVAADSLEVQNGGKILIFDKRVRVTVEGSYGKSQPKTDGS